MTEEQARERVKDLKSFYSHLTSYILVNAGLITTFFLAGGPEAVFPPLLVALGWGGGLCIHAMRVFGFFGIGSAAWEEQKVRELLRSTESGLTREDLTNVLQRALNEAATAGDEPSGSQERVLQRLENLETIVTSHDWDALPMASSVEEVSDSDEPDIVNDEETDAQRAKRIARRVR